MLCVFVKVINDIQQLCHTQDHRLDNTNIRFEFIMKVGVNNSKLQLYGLKNKLLEFFKDAK